MNVGKISVLTAAVLLGSLAGCAHTPTTPPPGPAISGFPPCNTCDRQPPLPRGRFSPVPAPLPGTLPPGTLPPGALPPGAVPQGVVPQGVVPQGTVSPGTPPLQNDFRGYSPTEQSWKPLPARQPEVRLSPPEVGETQAPKDPAGERNILPVEIPQFAIARKQVASGLKPFSEGIDWLRDKGYRTVLFIRAPGEDDSAARRQFTAKGFRYLSLEVSPLRLSRELIDEFNRLVTDPANLPLFVYDRDSSLQGGMWYLHFRISEGHNSDRAAIEAGRLGLNIDADGGPHRDMWLAIQRFLEPMSKPAARLGRIHTVGWTRDYP